MGKMLVILKIWMGWVETVLNSVTVALGDKPVRNHLLNLKILHLKMVDLVW